MKIPPEEHSSHLMDPVGTMDTNCPACLALWDAQVHRLATLFAAQLARDCPELGEGIRVKILAAWFKAAV